MLSLASCCHELITSSCYRDVVLGCIHGPDNLLVALSKSAASSSRTTKTLRAHSEAKYLLHRWVSCSLDAVPALEGRPRSDDGLETRQLVVSSKFNDANCVMEGNKERAKMQVRWGDDGWAGRHGGKQQKRGKIQVRWGSQPLWCSTDDGLASRLMEGNKKRARMQLRWGGEALCSACLEGNEYWGRHGEMATNDGEGVLGRQRVMEGNKSDADEASEGKQQGVRKDAGRLPYSASPTCRIEEQEEEQEAPHSLPRVG
eukprot:766157-Pelagomonas_calceolata.AAC.4